MFTTMTRLAFAGFALVAPVAVAEAQDRDWSRYQDPEYGFSAELPTGLFQTIDSEDTPGIRLVETGGDAQLSLYGGPAEGMNRDTLEARLSSGEQIGTITYRAGGDSWFVLSGFYEPFASENGDIFYTKVLFSPDRQSFSAFEISFPAEDKPRFEPIVDRIEKSFTRPRP